MLLLLSVVVPRMINMDDTTSAPTNNVDTCDVPPHDDVSVPNSESFHHEAIPESDGTISMTHRLSPTMLLGLIKDMETLKLGTYRREQHVSNVVPTVVISTTIPSISIGRQLFDVGYRLLLSYEFEMAALYLTACLDICPHAALVHGLIAVCHGPNYNLKGTLYYTMSYRSDDANELDDRKCTFPSQHVADRHSAAAMTLIDEIQHQQRTSSNGSNDTTGSVIPELISDVEIQLLSAIRIFTGSPGIDPNSFDETVGRNYANAMRKVYQLYPNDPDVAYFFVDSLMVLNAWMLYEYPTGTPVSPDVNEIREVLERTLLIHSNHPGLIHMYIHLSEMSAQPERALPIGDALRSQLPHAGHLIHMPTHIDLLLGHYDTCIRSNIDAIQADLYTMQISPLTAGRDKMYFGYIVHNFHMAIYGSILGGMEQKGMEIAADLNALVNESLFNEHPHLVSYLETYSATEIHLMVRFGRWNELLEIKLPADESLMLYRTATILYGRALARAMTGNITEAKHEADRFDDLRDKYPEGLQRILHNNTVADLLAVDAVMMRGEITYREGYHNEGLALLRTAVELEDHLNFDAPWGKMQPIRHALGGLLLEQGQRIEAETLFRKDLEFHPRNPWALVGLIECLERKLDSSSSCCISTSTGTNDDEVDDISNERVALKEQFRVQRKMEWADFDIVVPCECCHKN